jgi:hypothetical protein
MECPGSLDRTLPRALNQWGLLYYKSLSNQRLVRQPRFARQGHDNGATTLHLFGDTGKAFPHPRPIEMDQPVTKANHCHHCLAKIFVKIARLNQKPKYMPAFLWVPQLIHGDNVRAMSVQLSIAA